MRPFRVAVAMAFHISIVRIRDDNLIASYPLVSDNERAGVFTIVKSNGVVSLEEQMPGDQDGRMFTRAAIKIMRAWKGGDLPLSAEWAS